MRLSAGTTLLDTVWANQCSVFGRVVVGGADWWMTSYFVACEEVLEYVALKQRSYN